MRGVKWANQRWRTFANKNCGRDWFMFGLFIVFINVLCSVHFDNTGKDSLLDNGEVHGMKTVRMKTLQ